MQLIPAVGWKAILCVRKDVEFSFITRPLVAWGHEENCGNDCRDGFFPLICKHSTGEVVSAFDYDKNVAVLILGPGEEITDEETQRLKNKVSKTRKAVA